MKKDSKVSPALSGGAGVYFAGEINESRINAPGTSEGDRLGKSKNMFKESETIEFKKSTTELKEAVILISAILNKHGRGEETVGIK